MNSGILPIRRILPPTYALILKSAMGKGGKNFYAVRVGRLPGIYRSWPECEQQVCEESDILFCCAHAIPEGASSLIHCSSQCSDPVGPHEAFTFICLISIKII